MEINFTSLLTQKFNVECNFFTLLHNKKKYLACVFLYHLEKKNYICLAENWRENLNAGTTTGNPFELKKK